MASDFLLEIAGIKGESNDSKHKETIEIESFSWGCSNAGAHALGGGGGAGKVAFQDVHLTTTVNKASPVLMMSCAQGKHIEKAVLYVRKQGGKQEDFYVITMKDLLISGYQSGDTASGGALPTDQFSLNFAEIKFEYKPQKPDGSLGGAVTGTWNLKTNKP
jgi:type VI secretion system secreted protein Hcp